MTMITRNSRARKGEVKGDYGGVGGEEEGNDDHLGMVQPSQQHVAPFVKGVECGLSTRGFRIVAAFWAGILISAA